MGLHSMILLKTAFGAFHPASINYSKNQQDIVLVYGVCDAIWCFLCGSCLERTIEEFSVPITGLGMICQGSLLFIDEVDMPVSLAPLLSLEIIHFSLCH